MDNLYFINAGGAESIKSSFDFTVNDNNKELHDHILKCSAKIICTLTVNSMISEVTVGAMREKYTDLNVLRVTDQMFNDFGFKNTVYLSKDKVNKFRLDNNDTPVYISVNVLDQIDDVVQLIKMYKDRLIGLDVTVVNSQPIIKMLVECFDIKLKTVNIFNEHSYFLVYRELKQKDPETDYGWYILRGLSVTDRNSCCEQLDVDEIRNVEDYLYTKTNMAEQNSKTYYHCSLITDVVLFPEEKKAMMFELIN